MNHPHQIPFRILAVALTSRGLGYAVLEGETSLIESSRTSVRNGDKNRQCIAKVKKLTAFYRPAALVLQDVASKGSRRDQRIKVLQREVIRLAAKQRLLVRLISEKQLRSLLLGNASGTKHEMAAMLTKHFPDELAFRLPPKRRPWQSEDSRMDIFDAVALAVAFRIKGKKWWSLTSKDKYD
jgi:Holliday junction resolvasome RuvABC endonuclease subunit